MKNIILLVCLLNICIGCFVLGRVTKKREYLIVDEEGFLIIVDKGYFEHKGYRLCP